MKDKKNIYIVAVVILITIIICEFCISVSLAAISPRLLGGRGTMTLVSVTGTLLERTPVPGSVTPIPFSTTPISSTIISVMPSSIFPSDFVSSATNTLPSSPTGTQELVAGITYAPNPTIGSVSLDSWCIPWNTESSKAQVQNIIDGVTIDVMIGGELFTVRYSGIELPDYSRDLDIWNDAFEANRELVAGKTVLLIKDRSDMDSEGRLLRYVLADSVFVNRRLVESGYAVAYSSPPDISCDGIFQELEALARDTGRGLWAPTATSTRSAPTKTPTPDHTGDIVIVKISPSGTVWQEPEEYVEIRNDGAQPVQLQYWTLSDDKNHTFIFPKFVLGSQQYCRIYTDQYLTEYCGFTYNNPSPIWDNTGDCAYLRNGVGLLIDTYCYD